jgi:hypothetical protein
MKGVFFRDEVKTMQNTVTIDKLKGVDDTSLVDWSMPRDKITEQLKRDGRLTIIENGCPIAVMLKVDDSTFEDTMLDLSRVQALRALKAAQANSVKNGLFNMTLDEINATIAATRAERKAREKSK